MRRFDLKLHETLLFSLFWILVVKGSNACQTKECIAAATRMRNSIDSSTEPCDDFYQFACGNFTQYTAIASDNDWVNTLLQAQTHVDSQLKAIMEDRVDLKESRAFELIPKLYKSCLNAGITNESKPEILKTVSLAVLREIGGWPMVEGDKWDETAFDWIELIHRMRKVGLRTEYLFDKKIVPDLVNSSVRLLVIYEPDFEFPPEVLLNLTERDRNAIISDMVTVAQLLGANPSTALHESSNVLEFERALANITSPTEKVLKNIEDWKSKNQNEYFFFEFVEKYPHLRWMDYFNAFMPTDEKIKHDQIVVDLTPAYFERLAEILKKTSERTIANYLVWRSLKALRQQLDEKEKNSTDCFSLTYSSLNLAVEVAYVKKFTNSKFKELANELVENIRSSFIDMVQNVKWMDDDTKKAAVDKAKAIVPLIGYPDELTDMKKLEDYYEPLNLNENEYAMNILRLQKFNTDCSFRRLNELLNSVNWFEGVIPTEVNAVYVHIQNSIQIPAAILQKPFLSAGRPKYMIYGSIGFILGHEITHGFDNTGAQYDLEGNKKDWWKHEAKSIFLNKTKCFIEQYGNFTVPSIKQHIDGKKTLGENIADNGGLKSAYYAYKKWTDRHGTESNLPGLEEYTPKQMFWISASQTWCDVIGDKKAEERIEIDNHPLDRFRVIGSLRNSREFAADFKCAAGTKMNPIEKCEIW